MSRAMVVVVVVVVPGVVTMKIRKTRMRLEMMMMMIIMEKWGEKGRKKIGWYKFLRTSKNHQIIHF